MRFITRETSRWATIALVSLGATAAYGGITLDGTGASRDATADVDDVDYDPGSGYGSFNGSAYTVGTTGATSGLYADATQSSSVPAYQATPYTSIMISGTLAAGSSCEPTLGGYGYGQTDFAIAFEVVGNAHYSLTVSGGSSVSHHGGVGAVGVAYSTFDFTSDGNIDVNWASAANLINSAAGEQDPENPSYYNSSAYVNPPAINISNDVLPEGEYAIAAEAFGSYLVAEDGCGTSGAGGTVTFSLTVTMDSPGFLMFSTGGSAIPEPSSASLALLGAGASLLARRRRGVPSVTS